MSNRLTNSRRRIIVGTLLQRAYDDKLQQMKNKKNALAEQMVIVMWGPLLWPHVDAIFRNAPETLYLEYVIRVRGIEGTGPDAQSFELNYPMPMPSERGCSPCTYIELERLPQPLAERATELATAHQHLLKEYNDTNYKLTALLDSVNTFKKLYEVFPELKLISALIDPAHDGAGDYGMRVVVSDELKKTLNLVPQAQEA